jgi:hypothetical protein
MTDSEEVPDMQRVRGGVLGAGVTGLGLLAASLTLADAARTVAGHDIRVVEDGMGSAALVVDGLTLLEDGVIYLDDDPVVMDGVTVVTGVAGAGGNACNAAPFVLTLPQAGPPAVQGPVESCAYLPIADVQAEAILFASDPVPATPGEIWVWTPSTGFAQAEPEAFAPTAGAGWDALDTLAGAHPADALGLEPVYAALVTGLGADYASFAERISGLGSGDLTAGGYLGEACLKTSCEADWAVLYLHRATAGVFAVWHVSGEIEPRLFPQDTTLWPPEAMAVLRGRAGP